MLLQSLETNTLIDMLSEETGKYIGMLHATSVDANEFYRCRLLIKELQREIETRKHISPLAEINKEKTSGQ
jgi:hypothetical protein